MACRPAGSRSGEGTKKPLKRPMSSAMPQSATRCTPGYGCREIDQYKALCRQPCGTPRQRSNYGKSKPDFRSDFLTNSTIKQRPPLAHD